MLSPTKVKFTRQLYQIKVTTFKFECHLKLWVSNSVSLLAGFLRRKPQGDQSECILLQTLHCDTGKILKNQMSLVNALLIWAL